MVKTVLSAVWRALPKRLRRFIVRAIEPTFTVATGAVIVDAEGRILLLRHVFRVGSGWGIPGGFIAGREQPEAGIRRELREEVGLEVDDLELSFVRTIEHTNQVEIFYRARPVGEPHAQGIEIDTLGWFRLDELPDGLSKDQRRVIARVLGR